MIILWRLITTSGTFHIVVEISLKSNLHSINIDLNFLRSILLFDHYSRVPPQAFSWPCSTLLSLLKLTLNRTVSWGLTPPSTEPQVTLHQSAQSGKITNTTDRTVQWWITYMPTHYTWRQIYISAAHVLRTINITTPLPHKSPWKLCSNLICNSLTLFRHEISPSVSRTSRQGPEHDVSAVGGFESVWIKWFCINSRVQHSWGT